MSKINAYLPLPMYVVYKNMATTAVHFQQTTTKKEGILIRKSSVQKQGKQNKKKQRKDVWLRTTMESRKCKAQNTNRKKCKRMGNPNQVI